jgi:hypothetical protein
MSLVRRLVPLLLAGDHPALAILRAQFELARIASIELSGVGFFAEIEVPRQAKTLGSVDLTGGHANIRLSDLHEPAGCVLFVRDGRLSMLEGYTYVGAWSETAVVLSVSNVVPIVVE